MGWIKTRYLIKNGHSYVKDINRAAEFVEYTNKWREAKDYGSWEACNEAIHRFLNDSGSIICRYGPFGIFSSVIA